MAGFLPDWVAEHHIQLAGRNYKDTLGTALDCSFQAISPKTLLRASYLSLAATVQALTLAFGAGLGMIGLAGIPLDQTNLALAAGALMEMGLIAMANHYYVAFVAVHHLDRILF